MGCIKALQAEQDYQTHVGLCDACTGNSWCLTAWCLAAKAARARRGSRT